jgi:molybdopterin synthase catalytic subunit
MTPWYGRAGRPVPAPTAHHRSATALTDRRPPLYSGHGAARSPRVEITVRLFAILRERAGWRERRLELPAGSSVGDAWATIVADAPALAPAADTIRFARNRRYTVTDEQLSDGDELALIPPVAGGSESLLRFELREDAIADELLAELRQTVPSAADGALVLFVGQTRETPGHPSPGEEDEAARNAGQPVEALDYEAYAEMALDVFRAIAAEIEDRFAVRRLAIVHRTGHVGLSEPSVVIAAAAPHRGAAFDACRYAIDELKARAPIWKRERYTQGSVWISGERHA